MEKRVVRWLDRLSLYLCLSAVMAYGVVFLVIVFSRIRFPFELEWMEGSSWTQVARILSGQPVYTAPTLDYVPLVYTPLYFYLSAAVFRLLGGGFFPLRLVSLLASLGCILLIFLLVREKTRRGLAAFLAAGLFMACYGLSDTWFDLARADMLFLFFYLLAILCLRGKGFSNFILAGVFFSLSFFTKQTALFFTIPILLYALIFMERRRALALLVTTLLLIGGSTLLLNNLTGGWYSFYIFELPRRHAFSLGFAVIFWLKDLLPPLAATWVLGFLYLLRLGKKLLKPQELFYPALLATLLAGSWAARANVGGAVNTLLPALAGMAILLGLGAAQALDDERFLPNNQQARRLFVTGVCLLQFLVLAYNPFAKIPGPAQLEAGSRLVEVIRQIDGEVFIPSHNYLNLMAGRPSLAHNVPIAEVAGVFGDRQPIAESDILRQYAQAVQAKRFAAIILDGTDTEMFAGPLAGIYQEQRYYQFDQGNEFFSVFAGKPATMLKFYFPISN
jgi:hypothetical protein